jgi:hypothetical protein
MFAQVELSMIFHQEVVKKAKLVRGLMKYFLWEYAYVMLDISELKTIVVHVLLVQFIMKLFLIVKQCVAKIKFITS